MPANNAMELAALRSEAAGSPRSPTAKMSMCRSSSLGVAIQGLRMLRMRFYLVCPRLERGVGRCRRIANHYGRQGASEWTSDYAGLWGFG